MIDLGEKPFRGEQIFKYFHQQDGLDISKLNLIPQSLRERLSADHTVTETKIFNKFQSTIDPTVKYLLLMDDGNIIESVVMEYSHGYSVCISTQVGCRMGCSFCASTKEGLIRNLTTAELLNQVYTVEGDRKSVV